MKKIIGAILFLVMPLCANQVFDDTCHLLLCAIAIKLRNASSYLDIKRAKSEILKSLRIEQKIDLNDEFRKDVYEKQEIEIEYLEDKIVRDILRGVLICNLCYGFLKIDNKVRYGYIIDRDNWESYIYYASIKCTELLLIMNIVQLWFLKKKHQEELDLQRNDTLSVIE